MSMTSPMIKEKEKIGKKIRNLSCLRMWVEGCKRGQKMWTNFIGHVQFITGINNLFVEQCWGGKWINRRRSKIFVMFIALTERLVAQNNIAQVIDSIISLFFQNVWRVTTIDNSLGICCVWYCCSITRLNPYNL